NRRSSTLHAGTAAPVRPTAAPPRAGAGASSEQLAPTPPASVALAGPLPHLTSHALLDRVPRRFSETFVRVTHHTLRVREGAASRCSKVLDANPWGVSPGFSISHYITVSAPSGGAGGRGLATPRALSMRRASGEPPETPERRMCPSSRNVT